MSVRAARQSFGVGEPVVAQVSVAGGGQPVRRCWVELRARVWDGRTRRRSVYTGYGSTSVDAPARRTDMVSRAEVGGLAQAVLPPSGITRQVTLPRAPSAPSAKASRVAVDYVLVARIELENGRKAEASAPVTVVSLRGTYQDVEDAEYFRLARRCDLELDLPAPRARPGEAIEGVLRVRPHEPVDARLVLRYLYWVQRGRGLPERAASAAALTPTLLRSLEYFPPTRPWNNFALLTRSRRAVGRAALARSVTLGEPAEFPFRIPVRADACPTLITEDCSVRYYVCGEIRYRRDGRDKLAREVNIHSG